MIDSTQWLNELRSATNFEQARRGLHLLLTNLVDQIGNGFQHLGVQPAGKVLPPDPLESLNVVANNGTVHAVLTHNAPLQKNIRYFVEADTTSAFMQPHVFDLGTSRTLFTNLPNKDGGGNLIPWHFRAYSQYQGSDSSKKITFGPPFNPTPVTVGGTAQFTPLASTGSGTAKADGTQGGLGLGTTLTRNALAPKRTVAA